MEARSPIGNGQPNKMHRRKPTEPFLQRTQDSKSAFDHRYLRLLAVGFVFLSACFCSAQSILNYKEIESLIREAKLSEAKTKLKVYLSASPRDATAHMLLGVIYDEENETAKAKREFEESVELKPETPSFRIDLGKYYAGNGNLHAAEKEFRYALKLDPGNSIAHSNLGLVLARTGRFAGAEAEFEAALSHDPHDLAALLDLLKVQLARKEFVPARHTASEIRRLAPPSADLYDNIGAMQATSGDYLGAIGDFRRANELHPGSYRTQYNLGLAYFRANNPTQAAVVLTRLAQEHDTAELENLLGEVYERQREYLKAVRSFQKAADKDPGNKTYRFDFIADLLAHHDYGAAILIAKSAVADFPQSERIHLALGAAQFGRGQYSESLKSFSKTAEQFPNAPLPLYFLAAASDTTGKDLSETQVLLKAYIRKHPEDAWPYYFLGRLAVRSALQGSALSRLIRAETLFKTSIRLDPTYADSHFELGKLYFQEKKWSLALVELRKAVQLKPALPKAHYELSQLYRLKGNMMEAKHELQLFEKLKAEGTKETVRSEDVEMFTYKLRK